MGPLIRSDALFDPLTFLLHHSLGEHFLPKVKYVKTDIFFIIQK